MLLGFKNIFLSSSFAIKIDMRMKDNELHCGRKKYILLYKLLFLINVSFFSLNKIKFLAPWIFNKRQHKEQYMFIKISII
jgi:hypothetical protein